MICINWRGNMLWRPMEWKEKRSLSVLWICSEDALVGRARVSWLQVSGVDRSRNSKGKWYRYCLMILWAESTKRRIIILVTEALKGLFKQNIIVKCKNNGEGYFWPQSYNFACHFFKLTLKHLSQCILVQERSSSPT